MKVFIDSAMTHGNEIVEIRLRNRNIFLESANEFFAAIKLDSNFIQFSTVNRTNHHLRPGYLITLKSAKNHSWAQTNSWIDEKGKHHSNVIQAKPIK